MNLLAGDIGGTKTLIGVYKLVSGKIIQLHKSIYYSKEWEGIEPILDNFLSNIPKDISLPKYCCLGVAGLIKKGKVNVTNLKWSLEESRLIKYLGIDTLKILNDFVCLAYGIPYLQKDQYQYIQHPEKNKIESDCFYAVIGAGTGLGICRGVINKNQIKIFASEGGHSEFSARSQKEWELANWIKNDLGLGRLSIERIISGTGIGHIARWRLSQEDAKSHQFHQIINNSDIDSNEIRNLPAKVSQLASEGDFLMKEVLDIWLSAYGSAAGDLALNELCTGGLWIAGGTAAKQLKGLQSNTFLKALTNKGRFSNYLQKLPIMALIDPEAGLFGAACKAHQLSTKSDSQLLEI